MTPPPATTFPTATAQPKGADTSLRPYFTSYIPGFVKIGAVTVLASLFSLLHPWPLQILIDYVIGSNPSPGWLLRARHALPGAESPVGAAAYIAVTGLIIFGLDALFDVLLTMQWIRVGQRMVYELACALYSRVLRRSLVFHARTPIGDTLSRVSGDSWCIYNVAAAVLFTPAHAAIVGGAAIVIMLRLNVTLTVVACAVAPILALVAVHFGRRIRIAKGREREAEGVLQSHVQRTLAGLPVVQAFAQEEREQRRFLDTAHAALGAQRRTAMSVGLCAGTIGLVTSVGTAAVIGVGAREVVGGRLSLGELLVFLAYLTTLHTQWSALATTYSDVRGLRASIDRVKELLRTDEQVAQSEHARPFAAGDAGVAVRFDHVTFGYVPGRPVLHDVAFDIPAGHTCVVVGASGSGKSTLAALILRLYDPWSGTVALDGHDIRELDIHSLRRGIGFAMQESILFPITVQENISLGRTGVTAERLARAARLSQAERFIMRLDGQFGTVLGDRGMTLSGGERQRLAVARALATDPALLVLDEVVSALDAKTEAAMLDAILAARRGRTNVVIAHRLVAAIHADMIVTLDAGRVVEVGTHTELLRARGHYARLWHAQGSRDGQSAPLREVSA